MKITSYKTGAGKRAREKVHQVDDDYGTLGVGHSREPMTGKVIPGRKLTLHFDGRTYLIELDMDEERHLKTCLGIGL
jgi:hypothetical protein